MRKNLIGNFRLGFLEFLGVFREWKGCRYLGSGTWGRVLCVGGPKVWYLGLGILRLGSWGLELKCCYLGLECRICYLVADSLGDGTWG